MSFHDVVRHQKFQRTAEALAACVPLFRAKLADTFKLPRRRGDPPKVLSLARDGVGYCSQFEVFFEAEGTKGLIRQLACTEANAAKGYIVRYTHARGRTPTRQTTEKLFGTVIIVWKDET